ncbi:DUF1799 domain-containing protein [Massilia alkalitolerans]|uniref:DUF1799 domain-containing protein n=1 Tax=Massilia alkalitolerans TaxID=286638 RepID=UPI00040B3450|nr:DUF1799 domain-containing protein [Massilia alkalitolerans]
MARGDLRFSSEAGKAERHVNEALAALGLYAVGPVLEQQEYWLWPENEEAFELWLGLQTQWNVGMAGAVGLNYAGVEACIRMRDIARKKRTELFASVQLMEQACLEEWAEKRKG